MVLLWVLAMCFFGSDEGLNIRSVCPILFYHDKGYVLNEASDFSFSPAFLSRILYLDSIQ